MTKLQHCWFVGNKLRESFPLSFQPKTVRLPEHLKNTSLLSNIHRGNSVALRNRLSFRLKTRLRVPFFKEMCINCKKRSNNNPLEKPLEFPLETQVVLNAIESPPWFL